MPTILFAITASPIWTMKDGRTLPAGFWAEEVADPYAILTGAGFTVQIATPDGQARPAPGLQPQPVHDRLRRAQRPAARRP